MIYNIKIDSDIDERVKEFNAKLPINQKIVSLTTSEQYLFITTEEKKQPPMLNLLHEELKKREISK